MKNVAQCPVCKHGSFTEIYPSSFSGTPPQAAAYFLTDREKAVHGRIVRCSYCGFVLTSPQFEPDEYERIYVEVASVEKPPSRSRAVFARYRQLSNLVRKFQSSGRFLDFGCGGGEFLSHMPEFDGIGLEVRPAAVAVEQAGNGKVIVGDLAAAVKAGVLKPASFDFVTTWDVLEHLPMLEDDVTMLKTLLRPRGWLFCSVPNVASLAARLSGIRWNCYLLEHLWYFSPKTLEVFAQRLGFAKRSIQPFMFPADVVTLASRLKQTYGIGLPIPSIMRDWTLPLPAGVMFGAFQLDV